MRNRISVYRRSKPRVCSSCRTPDSFIELGENWVCRYCDYKILMGNGLYSNPMNNGNSDILKQRRQVPSWLWKVAIVVVLVFLGSVMIRNNLNYWAEAPIFNLDNWAALQNLASSSEASIFNFDDWTALQNLAFSPQAAVFNFDNWTALQNPASSSEASVFNFDYW